MSKITLTIFVSIFLFYSCIKEGIDKTDSLQVEFGIVCGWCGGEEKITVTESKIVYYRNIPCGENKQSVSRTLNMDTEDWKEIKSSFNYGLFLTLTDNTCNVCADGCDEFISATKDGSTHKISYNPTTSIEGFEEVQERLKNLMEQLKNLN